METDNKIQPDKKEASANRIFFAVFFALIAVVVTVTFCKYFILRDYYITAQADCDPENEKCFIWRCDPKAEDDSEKCTGDPEEDTWYYKMVKKNANAILLCDPNSEECPALECFSGEDCIETRCDGTDAKEGEECNDPKKYLEELKAQEEESASEEEDTGTDENAEEDTAEEKDIDSEEQKNNLIDEDSAADSAGYL
jgi:hypothetical protein